MWGTSIMDVLLSRLQGYGDVPEFEVFKIEKLDDDMWRIECKDNLKAAEAARKEKETKQDA